MAANEEQMDVQEGQDVIELELEHATEGCGLGAGMWCAPETIAPAIAGVRQSIGTGGATAVL